MRCTNLCTGCQGQCSNADHRTIVDLPEDNNFDFESLLPDDDFLIDNQSQPHNENDDNDDNESSSCDTIKFTDQDVKRRRLQ